MENAKELKRRAQQQGTMPDKIPEAAGIAEFARTKAKENTDAAGYVREIAKHAPADVTYSLNQEEFLNLIGDITSKISPIDPPTEASSSPAS